jgi:hypothetical protein
MRIEIDDKNYVEVREVIDFGTAGQVWKLYQTDDWEAGSFLLGRMLTKIVLDGVEHTSDLENKRKDLPMLLGTKAFKAVTKMYDEQMFSGEKEAKK